MNHFCTWDKILLLSILFQSSSFWRQEIFICGYFSISQVTENQQQYYIMKLRLHLGTTDYNDNLKYKENTKDDHRC